MNFIGEFVLTLYCLVYYLRTILYCLRQVINPIGRVQPIKTACSLLLSQHCCSRQFNSFIFLFLYVNREKKELHQVSGIWDNDFLDSGGKKREKIKGKKVGETKKKILYTRLLRQIFQFSARQINICPALPSSLFYCNNPQNFSVSKV